ncbi:hypothetical protein BZA05DRAFT_428064, partial [Tricharina praecox]|uniref:uncharacterized protein n=1 Tax=Tricharina praecox TaxID=43433 RepID=UPI00221F147C
PTHNTQLSLIHPSNPGHYTSAAPHRAFVSRLRYRQPNPTIDRTHTSTPCTCCVAFLLFAVPFSYDKLGPRFYLPQQ